MDSFRIQFRSSRIALLAGLSCALSGCMVGPKYHIPRPLLEPAPAAYKESTAQSKENGPWKVAEPRDAMLRGKWWEIFGDPELDALENQLNINNFTLKQYFQNYMEARALIGQAKAQLYPTLTVSPEFSWSRTPNIHGTVINGVGSTGGTGTGTGTSVGAGSIGGANGTIGTFSTLPFEASWEPDLWGRIRYAINEAAYNAQVSAADLENERLAEQASLASYFFELRAQDALEKLYNDTVAADRKSLAYTKAQYETGVGQQISVVEAETTLDAAQASATGVGIARAQYEHAIAVLVGKNPSSFSIPVKPSVSAPPPIPVGVPSQLLERRPDIAAAERTMAAANAQIGIAHTAYYPTLTLSAAAGFEATDITKLLDWPNRFWSIGPSATYTIFDAGLRDATVRQYVAIYNADVAAYRQTVLTAFQQVEDNLAGVRLASRQSEQQNVAVQSATKALQLEMSRYQTGIDPYIDVVTAQNSLLSSQQALLTVREQALTSAVQLVAALGGGWDITQLPTTRQVSKTPTTRQTAIAR